MNHTHLPPPYGQRPFSLHPPGSEQTEADREPAVVGSLWPPASELRPPPALAEWRRRSRRRPLWAWSSRSIVLVAVAASAVAGSVTLLLL